jgi:hypothetical protein
MTAWLDANCGADGWAMTPSGMRGVLSDAVPIYFIHPTLASAFGRPILQLTADGFPTATCCAGSCFGTHRLGDICDRPHQERS